jgi:hypothetical protein
VTEYVVRLPKPHAKQASFVKSTAKRNVVRGGRRGGKTVGVSIRAVRRFLKGRRILYATPTQEQVDRFWVTVTRALQEPIDAGVFYVNETRHIIELPGTEQRIRAKTAWDADSLRGDYADELILDEYQLMSEDAWGLVGAPMMADHDGNATFVYTPPSLHSRARTRIRARDPRHAAKLFKRAAADKTGRWKTFHFTSKDNPHISQAAVEELAKDMTALAYRMEILAEDVDEAPGALWTREILEKGRRPAPVDSKGKPLISRIVVGVDPSGTSTGAEAGIVVAGRAGDEAFVLADGSLQASPAGWAAAAIDEYNRHHANLIVAEANYGGEMVKETISTANPKVPVKIVFASRGKQIRAEPISAMYQHGHVHHVGSFPMLEDEQCLWIPGDKSPNRMDALVWALTELMLKDEAPGTMEDPFASW